LREQVWDWVFERKTALAVKEALEKEDPKVTKLLWVVRDNAGKDIGEWEALQCESDLHVKWLHFSSEQ
jgi:hypothetical protein